MHQFCYASESTSEKQHLLEDLTAILSEARNFNYKHQISVLAFGILSVCIHQSLKLVT